MLSVSSLSLTIGEARLLDDVSFEVAGGELLALIGPNGAGKSSLIHAVIGDRAPSTGRVDFAGRALSAYSHRERACHVALLPQSSLLNFPFTVRDVVMLGRSPHASGLLVDGRIVDEACAAADIEHLKDARYTRLSGGEKQRVQLARVMTQIWRDEDAAARLLLLDEPVSALDIGHQQWVMERVVAFARAGVAVVMVMHDITLAARHADRMLALRDGRAIAQGTPGEVVTPDNVRAMFDTDTRIIPHPDAGTPVVLHA